MEPSTLEHTATIDIHNPATGEHVGAAPVASAAAIRPAADAARAAQERWAATSWRHRQKLFTRFHDLLVARAEQILDVVQAESGKARRDALAELITVVGTTRYYLAHGRRHLAEARRRPPVPLVTTARVAWHPHGLVGLITPWNFPLLLGVGDAIPALLAGNAVLTKPSEVTPLSTLLARDLLVEAGLDADLFQPLVGTGPELGPPLIEQVDYVGFTGSTATGRVIARAAADRLIPCSLELGGKNPMLVMPGANLDDAVHGLISGGYANSGQTCICVERVYVHDEIWDEFVTLARERVGAIDVGWSTGYDKDMGSLVSAEHAARVREHITEARAAGAELLAGGDEPLGDLGEAFVRPTLLTGTDPSMRIHHDETFGPVVRLERVASAEEAITRANDSEFGLNGSVWAGSTRTARELAGQLAVGTANINSTLLVYHSFDVPMGGIRQSGIGRRHAAAGIQRYCRQQSIVHSFARGGGYELLLRVSNTPERSRLLLRAVKLMRHLPGVR